MDYSDPPAYNGADDESTKSGPDGPVEERRHGRGGHHGEEKESKTCGSRFKERLGDNLMLVFLLIGIVCGVVMGVLIRHFHPDWSLQEPGPNSNHTWAEYQAAKRNRMYLAFVGNLFLRMLMCIIIPLIVSSLISGMASLPNKAAGRIGGFTVLYYLITTLIAVIIGIILVVTIKPGGFAERGEKGERLADSNDFILDLIRNIFPSNVIAATFQQTETRYVIGVDIVNTTTNETGKVITDFYVYGQAGGSNILGLVVFSIVLGLVTGNLGEKAIVFKEAIDGLGAVMLAMVRLIIWFAPIGIAFILAERIVNMEDPAREFSALAMFMVAVSVGLIIHAFIILPALYLIFARKNPYMFGVYMFPAVLTALGTSSSSATLPVTMRCMDRNARIDRRIAHFILPVGATINMDGTALYEAVAAIFVAQLIGVSLNVGEIITVAITSTAAAVGAAGVPEAGLVTISIVLVSVGLPIEEAALILTVDWLLDRLRTAVNVWGDSIGCGVVEALCKNQLHELGDEDSLGPHGEDSKKKAITYDNSVYVPDGNTDLTNL